MPRNLPTQHPNTVVLSIPRISYMLTVCTRNPHSILSEQKSNFAWPSQNSVPTAKEGIPCASTGPRIKPFLEQMGSICSAVVAQGNEKKPANLFEQAPAPALPFLLCHWVLMPALQVESPQYRRLAACGPCSAGLRNSHLYQAKTWQSASRAQRHLFQKLASRRSSASSCNPKENLGFHPKNLRV